MPWRPVPLHDYVYETVDGEEFQRIKKAFTVTKAKYDNLSEELRKQKITNTINTKKLETGLRARALIQKVAQETQSKLEYHISSLVTTALSSVFPDPYEFKVKFEQRRNKTECDLLFVKNGLERDPMFETGGGTKDVASFALRLAFWSLNKNRRFIALDEPMPNIHADDLKEKTADMIKTISSKLNVQLLIITDLDWILEAADKVFNVSIENGVSSVVEVNQ